MTRTIADFVVAAGFAIGALVTPMFNDAYADPAIEDAESAMTGDFDFLVGKWIIQHHRLKESMANSDEWMTFETRYEGWRHLDGAASIDVLSGTIDGKDFEGVSVRSYDDESDEWVIYWMDNWNTRLREQVRGRFEDGVGTFYGRETYRGTTYRMRFLWKDITDRSARWEQAYQDPQSGDWETNWVMEFSRIADK